MPQISPIPAVTFDTSHNSGDLSTRIAPPYDVLDDEAKAKLLEQDEHNIVAVDLPHLPAKTVGPDAVYEEAGRRYRQWLSAGVLVESVRPALFVYQQTYTVAGRRFQRRGLIANVAIQPFGKAPDGSGGIHPHEQTFSGPKEDRLKLMRATRAQLSPIFGIYSDPDGRIAPLLGRRTEAAGPACFGVTAHDDVRHEVWRVEDEQGVAELTGALAGQDIFIADGHHRYTTAMNYRDELGAKRGGLAADHRAQQCLFVLVAMQDPGMIVLPTHRVLGNMAGFSMARFVETARGRLAIEPYTGGDLGSLERELPRRGAHAMGLYAPGEAKQTMWIARPVEDDPLKVTHAQQSSAWRQLDVALVQHLVVEQLCQPTFVQGGAVAWKFPHSLGQLDRDTRSNDFQLGIVLQPTPLVAVRAVSEAGELMPQKSTFFYPKLATGLVINPLE